MASELLVLTLLRAHSAGSLAVVVVLLLRPLARRLLGVGLTYRLWVLAPASVFVSLFPTLSEFLRNVAAGSIGDSVAAGLPAFTLGHYGARSAPMLTSIWAGGAIAISMLFLAAEIGYRRRARRGLAGPALVGVAAPRFVTPHDYRQRFSEEERDLILRHERAHLAQGDPRANLLVAGLQILFWFNPLVHMAAGRFKLDQELACDALVIAAKPRARRAYAKALVKAHLTGPQSALVCAWAPPGGARLLRSPLEHRLSALNAKDVSRARYTAGLVAVGGLTIGVAAAVWVASPGQRYDAAAPYPGRDQGAVLLQVQPAAPSPRR